MQVASWPPGFYSADPVVSALHGLFNAFAAKEHERREGGAAAAAGAQRSIVDPTPLRLALSGAAQQGQLFQVGGWLGWARARHKRLQPY